jgi:hypothetical protein
MKEGDSVRIKNDPSKTVWVILTIKNGYAICRGDGYDRLGETTTVSLDNLELAD